MIIKRPYGFYKRHYKIIHFLLLIPMLYLALKFTDISNFFKSYIREGFSTKEVGLIESYLTTLSLVTLYFMIFAEAFIFWLEKSKKKFKPIYLVGTLYYLICVIGIIVFHSAMDSIDSATMDQTYAIFVRDLSNVLKYPGYIMMVWTVITAIGFNIKTLSFERDYSDIITEEDDEEVEIKFGKDSFEAKKNLVHFLREVKYYVLENKFVFQALGVLVLAIAVINIYLNLAVYNRNYTINQGFSLNSVSMTLKESYITNVDYTGEIIENDCYYLAIKLGLQNNSNKSIVMDKSTFRIYIDGEAIYPDYSRSSRFVDIGKEYLGNSILGITKDSNGKPIYHGADYVLVYELNKDQIKNQYQMKILNTYGKNKKNKMVATYKTITVKPKNIINKPKPNKIALDKEINLNETTLGNTTYKLHSAEIKNVFTYKYNQCINNNNCTVAKQTIAPSSGNTFLVIKDKINYDPKSSYYLNSKKYFYEDFGRLSFYFSNTNKTYTYKLKKINISNIINEEEDYETSVYEVNSMAFYGEDKVLTLIIRNKEYDISIE